MNVSPPNRITLGFQKWSKVASAYTMVTGASILLGWYTGFVPLKRLMPGSIVVKANTGALFLLVGLALSLLHAKVTSRWLVILRRLCSGLVLLVGALTLGEYLFGWDLGIDELLVHETLEYVGVFPGRMSPLTAFNFTFLGASLLLLGEFRRTRLAEILTVAVGLVSLQAAVAYLYGERALFQIGVLTPIAPPSAITFLIAGFAVLFVRPDQGWMAVITTESGAGMLARRLLPAALITPIVLGWLRLQAESSGSYDPTVIGAVSALAYVAIFQILVAWSVIRLQQIGLGRDRAEDELRRLYAALEERVLERTAQLAEANQRVQQERDQLQVLMDNVPDTIYFKDAASRFTRINPAQARTLGVWDPQNAIGKTDADFFPPEVAAASQAEELRLLQTGEWIVDSRSMIPTPDGQTRWFSSTKMPVRGAQGKVVGLVGISRDITERMSDEKSSGAEKAQLTERIEQMALVIQLSEQLQACAVDAEVHQVAARLAGQLFPGALGALYAIDPLQASVATATTWGTPPLEAQTFELDDCWALRRGKPHYWGGEHTGELCPHLEGNPPAFSVCLPLSAAGERLGILHLRSAPGVGSSAFGEIQMQSAQLAADSLALAWANVRLRESLHEQAVRDPLTGLYNRRHMQASLERELRRAAGTHKPIGIMMLDIDHFKAINDAHGHDAGDLVLRELGRFLKEHTRGGDIPCRLGGEEFLVILPEATLEQTMARAEKHRKNFGALRILYAGGPIETPTLSIGVAAYPKHGTTAEELLRAADLALYAAKEAGRDRVVAAE